MKASSCELPTWPELVRASRSANDPVIERLQELKHCRQLSVVKLAVQLMGRGVNGILRNPNYARFLNASWNELIDLYLEQVSRNRRFSSTAATMQLEELLPLASLKSQGLFRQHHQLPCTSSNARERARLIARLITPADAVILLGDDDLLSTELLANGFSDVTVIDIDPGVLEKVRSRSRALGLPEAKAVLHDLTALPPPQLTREYRLLVLDPPCNPEGLELFLNGALRLCTPGSRLLLHTHLMSQLSHGLQRMEALLNRNNLVIEDFLPEASIYPNPPGLVRLLQAIVAILRHTLLRWPELRLAECAPRFFISDALILSRRASRQP